MDPLQVRRVRFFGVLPCHLEKMNVQHQVIKKSYTEPVFSSDWRVCTNPRALSQDRNQEVRKQEKTATLCVQMRSGPSRLSPPPPDPRQPVN